MKIIKIHNINLAGTSIKNSLVSLLITCVEAIAKALDRRLLILDTQTGSLASKLYLKLDYTPVGEIPHFALSPFGELEPTCIFYKYF